MKHALLAAALLFSWSASAYFQIDLMKAKRANVEAKQWTLADWLAQKSRMRLMDQWLALHSSSNWLEFNASGAAQQFRQKLASAAATRENAMIYRADMFLSIFDIGGEFTKAEDKLESEAGAVGLRLLGANSQTTSLIVRYGLRRLNDFSGGEHWDNQFVEGLAQLYVVRFFGIDGGYRYYFPDKSNLAQKLSGYRTTAGAFVELSIARVFGEYFLEPLSRAGATDRREGLEFGVKLMF